VQDQACRILFDFAPQPTTISGMKSRRKVELAIEDLKRFATASNRDLQGYGAFQVIWNFRGFWDQLVADPVNMRELLKAAQLLSAGKGPGQGRLEAELFENLIRIALTCGEALEAQGTSISETFEALGEKAQPYWEVLHVLARFAVWCLEFRKRRDSFGGRRRVAAFEILAHAADFMNLPEAVRLAQQLEKSNLDDGAAATDFLMGYYQARGTPEKALDSLKILQLRITLRDIRPPIWRRILVSNDLFLGDLHYTVNRAMGWDNSHMHLFKFGRIQYACSLTVEDCGPPIRHEDSVTLAALIKRKGQAFTYEYDFGDSWEHEIKVEDILPFDPQLRLPVCLAGERACPPEDCGGVHGYYQVLEALGNPNDPKLRGFREWIGQFNPEEFDSKQVNSKL
jgi:hypothetical protein